MSSTAIAFRQANLISPSRGSLLHESRPGRSYYSSTTANPPASRPRLCARGSGACSSSHRQTPCRGAKNDPPPRRGAATAGLPFPRLPCSLRAETFFTSWMTSEIPKGYPTQINRSCSAGSAHSQHSRNPRRRRAPSRGADHQGILRRVERRNPTAQIDRDEKAVRLSLTLLSGTRRNAVRSSQAVDVRDVLRSSAHGQEMTDRGYQLR